MKSQTEAQRAQKWVKAYRHHMTIAKKFEVKIIDYLDRNGAWPKPKKEGCDDGRRG